MTQKIKQPIKCETLIDADKNKVFEAISSGKGWDSWFTRGTQFQLEKDSEILFSWKKWGPRRFTGTAKGKLIGFIPNECINFLWNYSLEGGPTNVTIKLEDKEGKTLLSVIERDYPDHDKGREMLVECSTGWAEALTLIKVYLEHGITYH